MNLRVAKGIKWFFDNLITMIMIVAGIGFLASLGWEAVIAVGVVAVVALVTGLVVVGCIKLYDKADRTVREVEDGEVIDR